MKQVIPKKILDTFQDQLTASYQNYCTRHGESPEIHNFILYALDQNLFSDTTVKRYCILKEFKKELPHYNNHKTRTVEAIAHRFHLSSRTVWSVVKNARRYEG